jgi:hypothetical protein
MVWYGLYGYTMCIDSLEAFARAAWIGIHAELVATIAIPIWPAGSSRQIKDSLIEGAIGRRQWRLLGEGARPCAGMVKLYYG